MSRRRSNLAAPRAGWQEPDGESGQLHHQHIVKTLMGGEQFVRRAAQTDKDLQHLEGVQAWRRGLGGKRMYGFWIEARRDYGLGLHRKNTVQQCAATEHGRGFQRPSQDNQETQNRYFGFVFV